MPQLNPLVVSTGLPSIRPGLVRGRGTSSLMAFSSVFVVGNHVKHCVMDAAAEGGPVAEAKLKEASDAVARLVRS